MTAASLVDVVCDGWNPAPFANDHAPSCPGRLARPAATAQEVRRAARADGWLRRNHRDMSPQCAALFRENRRRPACAA